MSTVSVIPTSQRLPGTSEQWTDNQLLKLPTMSCIFRKNDSLKCQQLSQVAALWHYCISSDQSPSRIWNITKMLSPAIWATTQWPVHNLFVILLKVKHWWGIKQCIWRSPDPDTLLGMFSISDGWLSLQNLIDYNRTMAHYGPIAASM